ncbi:NAD-dependent DNA ligase LigA [Helicobacter salomonis]|uniref:NAD-dependent DNA ligase LigA n=1 Tax=Helicobacter salomonis TaxID=56878 RepID=UPI000CF0D93E|nr:NAD-dependent DNA ligase LigA [Helicobacter salomonis]
MIQTFQDYQACVERACKYAHHYYVLDDPLISDFEYDALYQQIKDYERTHPEQILEHSPTQRVGDALLSYLPKHTHLERMWSLDNVFDAEGLQTWITRILKVYPHARFTCSPKLDGVSLNLFYDQGKLISAATRGNGVEGELVTHIAKTIPSIPLRITHTNPLEIRGEVGIEHSDFEKLNQERLAQNQPLFANARNAAAGSLRQLDARVSARRKLSFTPWGLGRCTPTLSSFKAMIDLLLENHFLPMPFSLCESIEDIQKVYMELYAQRKHAKMAMDGMVVVVDDFDMQNDLGFTLKAPRFAIAYKFPANEKHTRLLEVIAQVGRSGAITPVACLEPVNLDGAQIARATLNSYTDIQQKDLQLNDMVVVLRSGDVIPQVIKPLTHLRDGSQKPIIPPSHCPACQSVLEQQPLNICPQCHLSLLLKDKPNFCPTCALFMHRHHTCPKCDHPISSRARACPNCAHSAFPLVCSVCLGALEYRPYCYRCNLDLSTYPRALCCANPSCSAKLHASLVYFASKQGLEIAGLGDKVVKQLLEAKLISQISDLYTLQLEDLLKLEGWKQKRAQNLLNAIAKTRHTPLWRLISALGIGNIGKGASKKLADVLGLEVFKQDYQGYQRAFQQVFQGVKEDQKGDYKSAQSFWEFVQANQELIAHLMQIIQPTAPISQDSPNHFFKSKIIVITGSFAISRQKLTQQLEELGAQVKNHLSSKTDFLLCGANPGSKLEQARIQGIAIIEEAQLRQILGID